MTDIREIITAVKPGEETLLAAVTNLVLSRKQSLNRGSQVFLDGHDIIKVMNIITIINDPGIPAEVERYGRPSTDTIPTPGEDELETQLGQAARRGLRARLDGQQSVPTE